MAGAHPPRSRAPRAATRGRLSASPLWAEQRRFFLENGVSAWAAGTVPHYITNNPRLAGSYAELVAAWIADGQRGSEGSLTAAPRNVYLVELGSGSGRFAYHFLRQFLPLHRESAARHVRFTYVLTDFAEPVVDFWLSHAAFEEFFSEGHLDVASFDVESPDALRLRFSGEVVGERSPGTEIVVVANYLFDSIRQDAFGVSGGALHEIVGPLAEHPREPGPTLNVLDGADTRLTVGDPVVLPYYGDDELDRALASCGADTAEGRRFLFPVSAARCIQYFRRVTDRALLVLAADRGSAAALEADGGGDLGFSSHGSFSLRVNFGALGAITRHAGGEVLVADAWAPRLVIAALLFGRSGVAAADTRQAFTRTVITSNPLDFYRLALPLRKGGVDLPLDAMLSAIRLSGHDPRFVADFFDRLMDAVGDSSPEDRAQLAEAARRVWDMYFDIGEDFDLAFHLGALLLEAGYQRAALWFFEESERRHGVDPATSCNRALCHYRLGELPDAIDVVRTALTLDPSCREATSLLAVFRSECTPATSARRRPLTRRRGPFRSSTFCE